MKILCLEQLAILFAGLVPLDSSPNFDSKKCQNEDPVFRTCQPLHHSKCVFPHFEAREEIEEF